LIDAALAVPGEIDTPTGGYAYARALLAHGPQAGLALRHVALPGGFPVPDAGELERAAAQLGEVTTPLIVDGLALGALPDHVLDAIRAPLIALCHHPLGLETGLDAETAARLIRSERAALARARAVIVTSRTTAGQLVADFGVPEGRITLAPPGLDPAEPAPRGNAPPMILSVGSLTPRKGHDVLIRALGHLAPIPWRCVIAGPADRDPAWAARLAILVRSRGLEGRVEMAGAVTGADLDGLYARADIFCLPSRHEGYGMVFAEAMMRGLPVIACRAGAVPEVVPPAAGLLAPVDDDLVLAEFLSLLLASPAVAARMAAQARRHALSLPGWEETARTVARTVAGVAA